MNLLNQRQSLLGITVESNQADIGMSLFDDVRKEFVPRALSFKPDAVHAEEIGLQSLARGIVWIDDGKSKDVAHAIAASSGWPASDNFGRSFRHDGNDSQRDRRPVTCYLPS